MTMNILNHPFQNDPILNTIISDLDTEFGQSDLSPIVSLILQCIFKSNGLNRMAVPHSRFISVFGNAPKPERILRMSMAEMKASGLTRPKASLIRNIALHGLSNPDFWMNIATDDDDCIRRKLRQIKGLRPFDIEWFLFVLGRKDVDLLQDPVLQSAMTSLYGLTEEKGSILNQMVEVSDRWRPNRSLACRAVYGWWRTKQSQT